MKSEACWGTRKLAAALAQVQQDCQIRQSFADAEPTHRSEAREEDLGARTQVLEQMVDYFSTLRDDYSSRLDELKQKQELQAQGKTRPPPRARIFGGRKPKPKAPNFPAGNVGDEMKELTATLEKAALQLETTLTRKVSTDHVEAPTPEVEDPDAEEAEGAEDPEDPEDPEDAEEDEHEQDEDEDEEDEEDEVEELEDEDLDEDEEPEELDEEQERGKAGAEVPDRTEDADDAPDAGLGGTLRLEDPVVEDPAVETKPLEDEAPQPKSSQQLQSFQGQKLKSQQKLNQQKPRGRPKRRPRQRPRRLNRPGIK